MTKQFFPYNRRSARIGDIKESILTEAQFQQVYDGTWVLMDGRDISGSDLAILTGENTLPDARGQFLRCKNNGRSDGQQDKDGERTLGSHQAESFKSHNHGGGNHNHGVPRAYSTATYGASATANNGTNPPGDTFPTTSSGNIISTEGGNETRPQNIAVNFFIKIYE